jgi:hypothetical protein
VPFTHWLVRAARSPRLWCALVGIALAQLALIADRAHHPTLAGLALGLSIAAVLLYCTLTGWRDTVIMLRRREPQRCPRCGRLPDSE